MDRDPISRKTSASADVGTPDQRRRALFHRRGLVGLCLLAVLAMAWCFYIQPWLYVERLAWSADEPTSPELRRAEDALVGLGPRAFPQILDGIGSGRVKRGAALSMALRQAGEPGHEALLAAIDHESDTFKRYQYINALMLAFDDLNRTNVWIDLAAADPRVPTRPVETRLQERFNWEVPPMRLDRSNTLNPQFLTWYDKRSQPNGPLPPRRP